MKKSTAAILRQWKILTHLKEEFLQSVKLFCANGDPQNKIALMVTVSDEVYAILWNEKYFSAFGISGRFTRETKILPHRVEALCEKSISGMCIGNGKTEIYFFAWTSDGAVYSWGYNSHSQLGNGETSTELTPPALVAGLAGKKIIAVRAGDHHVLALEECGDVYAWGYNGNYCIGNGSNVKQDLPILIEISASLICKVVDISCGPYFSVALTDTGEIFTWGQNSVGQMGNGNTATAIKPIQLSNFETFSKVVCGKDYVLALTTSNVVYGWGINSSCELGISDKATRLIPTALPVKHVVDISAHFTSGLSICQTIDGKVHIWGKTYYGCIEKPMEVASETMEDALACFSVEQTTPKMIQFGNYQENEAGREVKGILLDFINDAFDTKDSADLVFKFSEAAEDQRIYAHRTILEIRNPRLAKMFIHLENQNGASGGEAMEKLIVRIDHAKYPVYRAFLLYLYTDKIELPYEGIMDLMKLAQAYGEPKLREECGKILTQKLSPDTAPQLYAAAIEVKDNKLKEAAVKYIADNYKEVVRSGKLETSALDTPAIFTLLTEFAIRKS